MLVYVAQLCSVISTKCSHQPNTNRYVLGCCQNWCDPSAELCGLSDTVLTSTGSTVWKSMLHSHHISKFRLSDFNTSIASCVALCKCVHCYYCCYFLLFLLALVFSYLGVQMLNHICLPSLYVNNVNSFCPNYVALGAISIFVCLSTQHISKTPVQTSWNFLYIVLVAWP